MTGGFLLRVQSSRRIHPRRAPCRQQAREERYQDEKDRYADERRRVGGLDLEQQLPQESRDDERAPYAEDETDQNEGKTVAEDQRDEVLARGSEGHAYAHLVAPLAHVVGEQAVQADQCQEQRDRGKEAQ